MSLEEKDDREPGEWRNLIKLEYAVLDRGGRPLLYNMEEQIPYSEEVRFLTGSLGAVFSRVPGKL